MKCARLFALAALAGLSSTTAQACDAPWSGVWNVTAAFANGTSAAAMTLQTANGEIEGAAGPLDEAQFFPLKVKGKASGDGADLELAFAGKPVGTLSLSCANDRLSGKGTLYATPVTVTAARPAAPSRKPTTNDFAPTRFSLQYSSSIEPVLTLVPGDRVRTTTLDNEGQDEALRWKGMPGNTLTGPFYVEGAMPGDTLVVHLERVALNRDTAKMASGTLSEKAVGAHPQTPAPGWDRTWILDRSRGVARLKQPGDRLTDLKVPLRPMLGSIGVAAPLNQAIFAGDLGFHGGNLDYSRITEGATIYLPVWRGGAYLYLGDGHALQGDGEISGQGLETSLEVVFKIELIKGKSLGQVRLEDADDVMVSGIDNSLDTSLQMATAGMARWLKDEYALNDSEVAALLSSSIAYDIAEVVDPRPHVVARISKKTLKMIRKK